MRLTTLLLIITILFSSISSTCHSEELTNDLEVVKLRNEIIELSNEYNRVLIKTETDGNNRLARQNARALIKLLSHEVRGYLAKQGVKRTAKEIEEIITVSYACSWIFTDFGEKHTDRLLVILQWAKDESNFKSIVSHWKAGTYLKSLNKTVPRDCTDYGVWQINDLHLNQIPQTINSLYENGTLDFKVKRVRKLSDFLDIPTNCVARCLIETDRRELGWEWKHTKDVNFERTMRAIIKRFEKEGVYDTNFVEKFYNIEPIKTYSLKNN